MELYKKAIYVAGEMADETYLDVLIVARFEVFRISSRYLNQDSR